ncbi:MAG: M50 family metallopeptidase [Bacillota bacterium]
MRVFTVAGIPVYLNPYFVLMIAAYVAAGLGAQVLILCLVVIAHELAHLLVARVCGVEVLGIEVFPFGGMARTGGMPADEPVVEAVIATAGPLNNFLLYGLGLAVRKVSGDTGILSFFLDSTLSLGFFNLLPALPLDGGRILRGYIARVSGYGPATVILSRVGNAVALVMFLWGIYSAMAGNLVPNLFAFAFFVYVAGRHEAESARFLVMRALMVKRELLRKRRVMPLERVVAIGTLTVAEICPRLSPNKHHLVAVVGRSGSIDGQVWESELLECFFSGRGDITLEDLARHGSAG